ncbi:pyridoxamine 5'-phosphate oxidase family protein [Acrocarpospora phusangensis]|uniref:pyridoxamine 5'-phosphate oxidase family protein n=1 Tax=Acrocarpospora phusangensis TaxID=1070424 RepID=UPI001EF23EF7|nr:pyridoxamine 5'-phosphate oxidase family protein [Acrocarpospora phusangensis]
MPRPAEDVDSAGLRVLSSEDCLRLLGRAPIGRIVFTDRALPAVQPVNYLLVGQDIVIRTAIGSRLAAATRSAVVAFEVDEFDPLTRTGWSVTAVGRSRAVTEFDELQRLNALPLTSWAPGDHDHFIVMRPQQLTGRQIIGTAPTR